MSFVARLWNTIRNPVRYVGRDLEGNKFYEAPAPNDPSYTKRTVQYFEEEEVWQHISGGKRLPIQWSAWLTHTRKEPPTIEELEADIQRQLRLSANVARIEARDAAEAAQMLKMRQQDARLALADASAQARSEPAPGPTPAASQTEPAGAGPPTPRNVRDAEGAVVRPPSFLTPSKPRKARAAAAPFALPALEEAASEQLSPAQPKEGAAQSPWISKPDETESWTPRAVRRG